MPSAALKSLARKAKKSIETAERYWKEALAYAKKKSSIDDKFTYAMAVVKKRLGLSDSILLDLGAPVDALTEDCDFEIARRIDLFEEIMISALLCEAYRASRREKSNAFFFNIEEGAARLRYGFLNEVGRVFSEKMTREELLKLFPNVPEHYIALMLCESFSMEDLKKLFPNIDLDYVKFLAG
jgi:hypothetical protein